MIKEKQKFKSRINYFLFGFLTPSIVVYISFLVMEKTKNIEAWIFLLILAFIIAFIAMNTRLKSLNMSDTLVAKILFTSPLFPIVVLYLLFAPDYSFINTIKKRPQKMKKFLIYLFAIALTIGILFLLAYVERIDNLGSS
jgi:uncharacterized membrane protein